LGAKKVVALAVVGAVLACHVVKKYPLEDIWITVIKIGVKTVLMVRCVQNAWKIAATVNFVKEKSVQ
jgi:hypothetical protein